MDGRNGLPTAEALLRLFDEAVALFHRLKVEAEQIHKQGEMTAALRGTLLELRTHGAQTVPSMARMRPVSRQHVQQLVNRLIELGFVELIENPAHKRSQLVQLTPKGERKTDEMAELEKHLLLGLDAGLPLREIEQATCTLKKVRSALERREWKRKRRTLR
jgi:DNA-binding MarR family transcriptional regulator